MRTAYPMGSEHLIISYHLYPAPPRDTDRESRDYVWYALGPDSTAATWPWPAVASALARLREMRFSSALSATVWYLPAVAV